jgi:transcriptional regulator with XRE-family HTH domain
VKPSAPRSFGAQLKALREAAGFTQEELATMRACPSSPDQWARAYAAGRVISVDSLIKDINTAL